MEEEVVQHADGNVGTKYSSGRIIQEAVHEGLPPRQTSRDGTIIKYAMNVWIRENDIDNLDKEAYKTSRR